MRFRVKLFRTATREVDQILDWLIRRQKAPAGAKSWFRAYENAIARLRSTADSQPLAPEDEFADFEIRQLLFKVRRGRQYYWLIFTIVGDQARVLHVRSPGQDLIPPEKLVLGDGT